MSAQAVTRQDWLEENQRLLTEALAQERAGLSRPADDEGKPGKAREMTVSPPALERLAGLFGLTEFERRLLLWCAGAELDAEFAGALADAQHDPTRRRPCFSLALATLPGAHWSAITPAGALRYFHMMEVSADGGLAGAALRIDERILHYLLGISHLDERLTGTVRALEAPTFDTASLQPIAERMAAVWRSADAQAELPVLQVTGVDRAARRAAAQAACANLGLGLYELQAGLLPVEPRELDMWMRLWDREALLEGSVLLAEWEEAGANTPVSGALARLAQGTRGALILAGRSRWAGGERSQACFEIPALNPGEQEAIWREELGEQAAGFNGDLSRLTAQFQLTAPAIHDAAAAFRREPGGFERLWQASREQARPYLDELAQRIQSQAGWRDLVLPPLQENQLRQVAAHVRQRNRVYLEWGFARRSARGLGTSAVFSGPSGTGKTLAAEVLANELSLDLYRIDLAAVVSKYIGETEKNLRRLFDAAEEGGAILFFDEADALFGRRSEVKDSHDRYANIEVSYLLQRMEAYRGLSILATNMPEALDPAFTRRIRFSVHFPFPAEEQRREIWRRIFPEETPTEGLDFDRLARLDLAGGSIYNTALHAAFLAAEQGSPVRMEHIFEAARGEYMRLEKPFPQEKGLRTG